MTGKKDLKALQKAQKDQQTEAQKMPDWVYFDEKGNKRVSAQQLGYDIMKEIPMIRANDLWFGARFDKKMGNWRTDNLADFLGSYITLKLESVQKWSQAKLSETKSFIFIKTFNSDMKESPFEHSKPYLANFKNGTYNIRTGQLQSHNIKDYILQSQSYAIDPDSTSFPIQTVEWLTELTGDKDSVLYLMELVGYCFYRSYAPFQCVTILQGSGANGKSTFLAILTEILGSNNVSNVTLQDLGNKQNRFASSNLHQKLANVFADIDSEFIKSTGTLKALTGGDRLSAEYKGKDAFMFVNFAKLIFSANTLPPFSDFSIGFERRLYVVPFVQTVDEAFKAKHDLKAIEKEIPLFAVECMRSFMCAMECNELTISDTMKEAKEKWLKESNHVTRFIEEYCALDMESAEGGSSRAIYEKYRDFCYKESLKELSQPNFTKQLEKIGVYKKNPRVDGQRMQRYIHLTLKSERDMIE